MGGQAGGEGVVREGHVVAGKYELLRPIARGGMGSVWLARHVALDVQLAVKFMDPTFVPSPEARTRFEREAKASAQLKSPHVVHVQDYGIDGAVPYIVMELLEGEDFGSCLQREGRLSLQVTVSLLQQVGRGLRKAHEMGIVHRDLKPGNIFLTRGDDGEQVVKILDFGIARTTAGSASDATKTGMLLGSPHYMSPEQARGFKDIDHRSDLWSLGIILYRALTGELPFPGDQLGDVIFKICAQPATPPSSVVPDLPVEVDRFFERALSREPAARFQSVREMVEAFAGVSISATGGRQAPNPTPASAGTLPLGVAVSVGDRTLPLPGPAASPGEAQPGMRATSPSTSGGVTAAPDIATLTASSATFGPVAAPRPRRAVWLAVATVSVASCGLAFFALGRRAETTSAPAADDAAVNVPVQESATTVEPSSSPPTPTAPPMASATDTAVATATVAPPNTMVGSTASTHRSAAPAGSAASPKPTIKPTTGPRPSAPASTEKRIDY